MTRYTVKPGASIFSENPDEDEHLEVSVGLDDEVNIKRAGTPEHLRLSKGEMQALFEVFDSLLAELGDATDTPE